MDIDNELIAAAPMPSGLADKAVAECWLLITRAMEHGWVHKEHLLTLRDRLRDHDDCLIEDLRIEFLGDELRVSLFKEQPRCSPSSLLRIVEETLRGPHPGTITYMEGDAVVSVRKVDEVPEAGRFADSEGGPVPVVKVVALTMGDRREIVEYGPNNRRLRSTTQMKRPKP